MSGSHRSSARPTRSRCSDAPPVDSAKEWLALIRRATEAKADESRVNCSALAVQVAFPQQLTLAGPT